MLRIDIPTSIRPLIMAIKFGENVYLEVLTLIKQLDVN